MDKTNETRLDNLFQTLSLELDVISSAGYVSPAVQRLQTRMRKRASYIKPELNQQGLDNFINLNESLLSKKVSLSSNIVANARHYITVALERYNTTLDSMNIQVPLDRRHLFDLWKFGPGASNGVKGTHTADKIGQKMTCTSLCEPLIQQLRKQNPYFSAFDAKNGGGTLLMDGSKMTTVPKNETSVRIIAIEPSGNMAMQLAAGQYLTNVLKTIGLDISTQQPKNKLLALSGSISNRLATIDLKSASDMFTPELIRLLFPQQWYDLLMQIRSPSTTVGDKIVELNMISTMGNGFTFPLMTFCLASLIYAYRCEHGGPNLFIDWKETAVFGDDIIIKSSEYYGFSTILEQAGLIVNYDKSYTDGPFRESCGGDFHLGVDITPFYVKALTIESEIYTAINQVLMWSGKNNIFLPKTLMYLGSLLPKVYFVPEWMNPNQGVLTTLVDRRYKYLDVVEHKVRLSDESFLMPLCIGGYVESHELHPVYMPRQFKTKYKVKKGRLPKGFLSGKASVLIRDFPTSARIDLYVQICLAVD